MIKEVTMARRLAPEDVRPGDFVAILSVVHDAFPPPVWEEARYAPVRPIRVECMNCSDGEPLRVVAVCRPFVRAVDAAGEVRTLDIRRHILARLSGRYAWEAFRARAGRAGAKKTR